MIAADCTGRPSSVKPIAPASRRPAISVNSEPPSPIVIAAMNPTGIRASRRAWATRPASNTGRSMTGSVFGIATIAQ